jgi:serine kinase of HPr protein (carbohydrate metabolism regulator)
MFGKAAQMNESDPARDNWISDAILIHASALLVGAKAIVVRGASGAGKSSLVLDLLATVATDGRFAMLIGDDRVAIEARNGRLVVRAAPTIAGLIERRGQGIARVDFEPAGIVGLIVDLEPGEPDRLPEIAEKCARLCGITVPRLQVAGFGEPRTRAVLAAIDAQAWMPDDEPPAE